MSIKTILNKTISKKQIKKTISKKQIKKKITNKNIDSGKNDNTKKNNGSLVGSAVDIDKFYNNFNHLYDLVDLHQQTKSYFNKKMLIDKYLECKEQFCTIKKLCTSNSINEINHLFDFIDITTMEFKQSYTQFEYYFTLVCISEHHQVENYDENQTVLFLDNFAKLINTPNLRNIGLQYICGELWESSRYFDGMNVIFTDALGSFLSNLEGLFTLSFIFKSHPRGEVVDKLLNTPKVNIEDTDEWYMGMDDKIWNQIDSFIILREYITIDLDNFYSQIFTAKATNSIDY